MKKLKAKSKKKLHSLDYWPNNFNEIQNLIEVLCNDVDGSSSKIVKHGDTECVDT